jgi:hypothetical protein
MEQSGTPEISVFQTKYNEFIDDLLGAIPEYTTQIQTAKALDDKTRLSKFQEQVKVGNTLGSGDATEFSKNPGSVLPGVEIEDTVWFSLSDNTKKAIWEYVRILSVCCFLEAGFSEDSKPAWMDEAMNEMKKQLEGVDFQNIINKFMNFMKPNEGSGEGEKGTGLPAGLEGLFENGFPKIPEKFLKGHLAKLAQEIVKDIKPSDLGISDEMIKECEKNPSRAFELLFQVFGSNPANIQNTVQKIGKRLQQKIMSGAIRPQEIAREAEELMKEFASNSNFVEMMEGIKGAFGFEDMDLARQAGKEGSARLAMVRERLKKKASEKEARKSNIIAVPNSSLEQADAIAAMLLNEESNSKSKNNKGNGKEKGTAKGVKK